GHSAAPATRESRQHQIRVFAAAGAAVVARQRAAVVVPFAQHVEAEDLAANADVEFDATEQPVVYAELPRPERHHLHQPDRAGSGYGVAVEAALDVHDREHELRRQLELDFLLLAVTAHDRVRLAVDVLQDVAPERRIVHDAAEPRLLQLLEHVEAEALVI